MRQSLVVFTLLAVVLIASTPAHSQDEPVEVILAQIHAEANLMIGNVTLIDSAFRLVSQLSRMALYAPAPGWPEAHSQLIINLLLGPGNGVVPSEEVSEIVTEGLMRASQFSIPGFSSYVDGRLMVVPGGISGLVEEVRSLYMNIEVLIGVNAEALLPLFEIAFGHLAADSSRPLEERMIVIESMTNLLGSLLERIEFYVQLAKDAATAILISETDADVVKTLYAVDAFAVAVRGCDRQDIRDDFPGLETALGGFFGPLWGMVEGLQEAHTAGVHSQP